MQVEKERKNERESKYKFQILYAQVNRLLLEDLCL